MRIAVIGLRGVPANYCGIDAVVEELGSGIAERGHEVTVFCVSGRFPKPHRNSYRGIHLRYVPSVESKNFEILIYSWLAAVASIFRPYDVYHLHQNASPVALLLRAFGKKTICTIHRQDWKVAKWGGLAKAYLKFGEWVALNVAHKTTVVSAALETEFSERHQKDVIYIPNGAPLAEPRPLSAVATGYGAEQGRYFLFLGRLGVEKNLPLLIEAFRGVRTDMKLVIVGGGEEGLVGELKSLAAPDPRIVFTGPQFGDVAQEFFSNPYLFVLPSSEEGMPIALLEAMAYGNAVLVSDIAPNVQVVEDGEDRYGFIFKEGDVEALRATLQRLVDDEESVADMRRRVLPYVRAAYSWDHAVDETLKVYEALRSSVQKPLKQAGRSAG